MYKDSSCRSSPQESATHTTTVTHAEAEAEAATAAAAAATAAAVAATVETTAAGATTINPTARAPARADRVATAEVNTTGTTTQPTSILTATGTSTTTSTPTTPTTTVTATVTPIIKAEKLSIATAAAVEVEATELEVSAASDAIQAAATTTIAATEIVNRETDSDDPDIDADVDADDEEEEEVIDHENNNNSKSNSNNNINNSDVQRHSHSANNNITNNNNTNNRFGQALTRTLSISSTSTGHTAKAASVTRTKSAATKTPAEASAIVTVITGTVSAPIQTTTTTTTTTTATTTTTTTAATRALVSCDVSSDVRLLRKIGYIASRVRNLAKIYGDFKLVNPYSPAKQRKQLQDIILRHSINEATRAAAAAAVGLTKIAPSRSLTPASSNTGSYCQLPTAESCSTRVDVEAEPDNEPKPDGNGNGNGTGNGEGNGHGEGEGESEGEGENEGDVDVDEDEQTTATCTGTVTIGTGTGTGTDTDTTGTGTTTTAGTSTAGAATTTVRRKSSAASVVSVPVSAAAAATATGTASTAVSASASASTSQSSSLSLSPSSSIVLLEDLLIQFYDDQCNSKITIMSGKTLSSSSVERLLQLQQQAACAAAAATATMTTPSAAVAATMTTTTTAMLTMMTTATMTTTMATMTSSTANTNDNAYSKSAAQTEDIKNMVKDNNMKQATNFNYANANIAQQQQQQQNSSQQHLLRNAFLQPCGGISGSVLIDDNLRQRRASDCSPLHPGHAAAAAAAAALSNQLQITLKNNNCTAKFPFHRGSCGAAGDHLLAANSIANRATIILSKSCGNVDVGMATATGIATTTTTSTTTAAPSAAGNVGISGGGAGVAGSGIASSASLYGSAGGIGTGGDVDTPTSNGADGLAGMQLTQAPTPAATASNGNNEFSILQLNNTIIQCHFNDDDFRALVKDLKRKVEYTERMNWLCLSKRPFGPPHRKSSLPKHQEVKKRFLEICDTTFSDEVKAALRLPAFDSYEWSDADVIHLMQTMFIELGFIEKFLIPVDTLREWLYEVYKHYNEVPFHNFRHCFCVAQMMYAITRQANLLHRLGDLECLILLVSCICHDLDHPGYNNIYQINARTELALRYNDISPLENHHCSIAFRLLEHPECNIFKNFSRDTFNQIREGIIRCILATDMARHNEILTQFKEITPVFDYTNRAHINLLCMVLIKVADISNEARPMDVAEPWLDRLLQEFFAQSAAEKSEGLPVTPFMDPDKVSKPGSQVRFIGLVLLPLFEALGELVPELTELIIIPVRVALEYYKRLNDAQTKSRKSVADSNTSATSDSNSSALEANAANAGSSASGAGTSVGAGAGSSGSAGGSGSVSGGAGIGSTGSVSPQMPRSQSGISVKSRRSIPSQKSASRQSVDEPQGMAAELHDLPEGSESGDSETATEVDVAEKTSKFKVDTEGSSNRSKSSHSTSRKSSREKRPSMIGEMCSSGGGQRMRNSYGNIHGYHSNRCHFGSNRAVSLDQYSSNNRRLSDGLQQVISDSNVFYGRHIRSSLETTAGAGPTAAGSAVPGTATGTTTGCHLIEDMNMNATGVLSARAKQSIGHQLVPNIDGDEGISGVSGGGRDIGGGSNSSIGTHSTSGGVGNCGPVNTNSSRDRTGNNVHAATAVISAAVINANTASNGNISPSQQTLPIINQHSGCGPAATSTAAAVTGAGSSGNGTAGASNAAGANANANAILASAAGTSAATAAAASVAAKSSWKTRLRQFSDYFSFPFDKGSKRFSSTRSSPCSMRNNNANTLLSSEGGTGSMGGAVSGPGGDGSKQGVCCTISNSLQTVGGGTATNTDVSSGSGSGKPSQDLLANIGRHRAYSLDVPCSHRSNPRYSSSSTGGGESSRKSSRHDGSGCSGVCGDDRNNSNNTLHSSSGAGSDMPTCMPPPIRIGSVDANDAIVFTAGVQRHIVTPANLDAEPSLSIDLGMASATSSEAPAKI